MKKTLKRIFYIFAAVIIIAIIIVTAFFINYMIKINKSTDSIGKSETQYTTDKTGSVILNIPYNDYIEHCDLRSSYVTPDISENNRGEDNSKAINESINAVSDGGGGTVYIPHGKYSVSTIELKSDVTLFLDEDAELISLEYDENKASPSPLYGGVIFAHDADNIAITGGGKISGNGVSFTNEPKTEKPLYALKNFNTYTRVIEARKRIRFAKDNSGRVSVINFENCTNTDINNVVIHESASWTLVINGGKNHCIKNVVIDNNMHVANSDGIDILNCTDVNINKCFIATGDDGVVLKPRDAKITNVKVADCEICSFANCFKIGTETAYDVANVSVFDCGFFIPDGMTYGYSGIAIESADGSNVSDIYVENIDMDGISSPIFIWLGNRLNYGKDAIGSINNISIKNVTAEDTELPSAITGCKTDKTVYRPSNINLENINVKYRDTSENLSVLKSVPEWSMSDYPDIVRISHRYFINHELSGYWDLPCYGIFIRYADVDYSGYTCTPRACNTRDFVITV